MDAFVKRIVLRGEDSIAFANSLFNPTKDEVEHFRNHLDAIDEQVTLRRTENGFEAEVLGLDLSDLHDANASVSRSISAEFTVSTQCEQWQGNGQNQIAVNQKTEEFVGFNCKEYLPSAA